MVPSIASVSQAVYGRLTARPTPRALALVDQAIACGIALNMTACNGVIYALANVLQLADCVAFLEKMRHVERGLPRPAIPC